MRAFGVAVESRRPAIPCSTVPLSGVPTTRSSPTPRPPATSWPPPPLPRGSVTIEGYRERACKATWPSAIASSRWAARSVAAPTAITVVGGPLRGIEADMNAISDTVPTLAAVALFADGPTTIRGVAHIRHKETDRIRALAIELRQAGGHGGGACTTACEIIPGKLHGATLETYDDHRMAMSLALVGLAVAGRGHPGPRLHGEDVSGLFCGFGRADGEVSRFDFPSPFGRGLGWLARGTVTVHNAIQKALTPCPSPGRRGRNARKPLATAARPGSGDSAGRPTSAIHRPGGAKHCRDRHIRPAAPQGSIATSLPWQCRQTTLLPRYSTRI